MSEDSSDEEDNNTATSSTDLVPTLATILWAYITRWVVEFRENRERLNPDAAAALFDILGQFLYPGGAAFLVAASDLPGCCSLEICNANEAESLMVNGVPECSIRDFIGRVLQRWPACNRHWQHLIPVDSCLCDHPFHRLVRQVYVDFLSSPRFHRNRPGVDVNRDPAVAVRQNWRRFSAQSTLSELLDFQRHVETIRPSEQYLLRQNQLDLLNCLLLQAIAHLLANGSDRLSSAPVGTSDSCPMMAGASGRIPSWVSTAVNNRSAALSLGSNNNNAVQQSGTSWLNVRLAGRNQADVAAFGEAAGTQCMAMAAMAIRFHQLLHANIRHVTDGLLDIVLALGNALYAMCSKNNNQAHLNFDELTAGMRRFSRGGWPEFTGELNAIDWPDLEARINARLSQHRDDGFLLVVNGMSVAVMRDRDTGHMYLFDSHGSNQMPTNYNGTRPAYLMQFDSTCGLFMYLAVQFGGFRFCEVHTYRCRF